MGKILLNYYDPIKLKGSCKTPSVIGMYSNSVKLFVSNNQVKQRFESIFCYKLFFPALIVTQHIIKT